MIFRQGEEERRKRGVVYPFFFWVNLKGMVGIVFLLGDVGMRLMQKNSGDEG